MKMFSWLLLLLSVENCGGDEAEGAGGEADVRGGAGEPAPEGGSARRPTEALRVTGAAGGPPAGLRQGSGAFRDLTASQHHIERAILTRIRIY